MRFIVRSLAVAAAVAALSAPAFAGQAKAADKASAKPAKATKATVISTTGTISKFDSATNTLTVTTAKGDASFVVDSSASVMASGKKVMASDLASNVGHKVSVRYTESGGQKTAQSVRVSAGAKTASAKKSSTTKKS